MLRYEPSSRISARQALQHPYFQDLNASTASGQGSVNPSVCPPVLADPLSQVRAGSPGLSQSHPALYQARSITCSCTISHMLLRCWQCAPECYGLLCWTFCACAGVLRLCDCAVGLVALVLTSIRPCPSALMPGQPARVAMPCCVDRLSVKQHYLLYRHSVFQISPS